MWLLIAMCIVCLIVGACFGFLILALCMANGGSDNESTGSSSTESKSKDTTEG